MISIIIIIILERIDKLWQEFKIHMDLQKILNITWNWQKVKKYWHTLTKYFALAGSNSGNKWQPVSDLEWCRLFDRAWHNKRITMSHSDSYMIESNEGKPKIQRKGQGKKGRGRPATQPTKMISTREREKSPRSEEWWAGKRKWAQKLTFLVRN